MFLAAVFGGSSSSGREMRGVVYVGIEWDKISVPVAISVSGVSVSMSDRVGERRRKKTTRPAGSDGDVDAGPAGGGSVWA